MGDIFVEAVKRSIQNFNKTRGGRKKLAPDIVDQIPLPNRKYGRIIVFKDEPTSPEVISRMAEATVRTLLRLKPRPTIMTVGMFEFMWSGDYLFRFKIPLKPK